VEKLQNTARIRLNKSNCIGRKTNYPLESSRFRPPDQVFSNYTGLCNPLVLAENLQNWQPWVRQTFSKPTFSMDTRKVHILSRLGKSPRQRCTVEMARTENLCPLSAPHQQLLSAPRPRLLYITLSMSALHRNPKVSPP